MFQHVAQVTDMLFLSIIKLCWG